MQILKCISNALVLSHNSDENAQQCVFARIKNTIVKTLQAQKVESMD